MRQEKKGILLTQKGTGPEQEMGNQSFFQKPETAMSRQRKIIKKHRITIKNMEVSSMKASKDYRILDLYDRLCNGDTLHKTEEAYRYQVSQKSITRDIEEINAFLCNRRSLVGNENRYVETCRGSFRLVIEDYECRIAFEYIKFYSISITVKQRNLYLN